MLPIEAARLTEILLAQADVSPLLNLGSSSRQFRATTQPHIQRDLFEPLERAGIEVVHSDLKEADGVDLAGDILDPATRRQLSERGFRSVLLANLLEHVRDRAAVAAACEEIVGPGGMILATVPCSYPYHADPNDYYYRPTPHDLGSLFARSQIVLEEVLIGPTYAQHLAARGQRPWMELARTLIAFPSILVRPRSYVSRAHRWLWYRRPYRVSVALVVVG